VILIRAETARWPGVREDSQIAFWACAEPAVSAEQVHDYDEYMLVVQGCYTATP
jgi:hypothetical protein